MPSVDFDAARRERLAGGDPIKFKLGGEEFTARPAIPFSAIAKQLADDTPYTDSQTFDIACKWIETECLLAKDAPRWRKALTNRAQPVGLPDVLMVLNYLMGCYVTRPTRPPAGSSVGRNGTGGPLNSTRSNDSGKKASGRSRAGSRSTGSRNGSR